MRASDLQVRSDGEGPDLVLLHGWAMHSGVWGEFGRQLRRHFTVHAIDLPGHGLNRHLILPESILSLGNLIAARTPKGAIWMGWSLGGLIALQQAVGSPAEVSALVLVASSPSFVSRPHWPHAVAATLFAQLKSDLARDQDLALHRFAALLVHGTPSARRDLRYLRSLVLSDRSPAVAALQCGLKWLATTDLTGCLAQIEKPVLVIGGQDDQLVPALALSALAARLPDARSLILDGTGHAPFINHPQELLGTIREWLHE